MTIEEKLVRRLRRDKLIEFLNLFALEGNDAEYNIYTYGELLEAIKVISVLEIKRKKRWTND